MRHFRSQMDVQPGVQEKATDVQATPEAAPEAGPPPATEARPGTDAMVAAAADVRAAVDVLREALREQAWLVASLIEENADLRRRAGEQQRTINEPERMLAEPSGTIMGRAPQALAPDAVAEDRSPEPDAARVSGFGGSPGPEPEDDPEASSGGPAKLQQYWGSDRAAPGA